jgi:hypothetical protein
VKCAGFTWENSHLNPISGLAGANEFHHIVAARYCGSVREAAALPGRFLPELGRFGFPKRPFFFMAKLFCAKTRADS